MYKLIFEDNELDRQRYEMCYQAVVRSDKAPEMGDWDDVIALLRKLKSIGEPDKSAVIGGGKNAQKKTLYDLTAGGGEIELERSEYKFLLECVKRPIWPTVHVEDAQDTKIWLESLKPEPKIKKVED